MLKNKKILLLIVALVVVALLVGLFFALSPKAEVGEKSVTVLVEIDGKSEEISSKTDALYLSELLTELQAKNKLEFKTEKGDYGEFITSVSGRDADSKSEYFAIYVNGEYGSLGVSQQPIADGDEFKLVLETF